MRGCLPPRARERRGPSFDSKTQSHCDQRHIGGTLFSGIPRLLAVARRSWQTHATQPFRAIPRNTTGSFHSKARRSEPHPSSHQGGKRHLSRSKLWGGYGSRSSAPMTLVLWPTASVSIWTRSFRWLQITQSGARPNLQNDDRSLPSRSGWRRRTARKNISAAYEPFDCKRNWRAAWQPNESRAANRTDCSTAPANRFKGGRSACLSAPSSHRNCEFLETAEQEAAIRRPRMIPREPAHGALKPFARYCAVRLCSVEAL